MELIYVDYAATTPLDRRVLDAMMPYLTDVYFNATSAHAGGLQAQAAVMRSRMEVAGHIGARFDEIVFTSGATEAINMAITGVAAAAGEAGSPRRTLVSVRSEHAAVRDAVERCSHEGFEVRWLPLDADGRIIMSEAERMIDDSVLLVSVMLVNNETGLIQDIAALSEMAHRNGALFMTDATQAYGKIPIDVDGMGIDLMTFSGHKIYGPKGIGALYIRRGLAARMKPLMIGGGQESGLRSGTQNVPGIVGLATAGRIALQERENEMDRIGALRDRFEGALMAAGDVIINCHAAHRVPTISSVTFGEMPAERILMELDCVLCSKGSACSTSKPKPSAVMAAMGRNEAHAHATLRFSFGRNTTDAEIDRLILLVTSAARQMSTIHQS
ncbi:MAG: cysteine desulfurase [Candidatus Kapabacteria bacterium]|nr:cysteine desulfurase [Candidatus Kapabacteria bacterium]